MRKSAFATLCACVALAAAGAPKDEALAELKRVAASSNFYYAVRVSEKTHRDEVAEKAVFSPKSSCGQTKRIRTR